MSAWIQKAKNIPIGDIKIGKNNFGIKRFLDFRKKLKNDYGIFFAGALIVFETRCLDLSFKLIGIL